MDSSGVHGFAWISMNLHRFQSVFMDVIVLRTQGLRSCVPPCGACAAGLSSSYIQFWSSGDLDLDAWRLDVGLGGVRLWAKGSHTVWDKILYLTSGFWENLGFHRKMKERDEK